MRRPFKSDSRIIASILPLCAGIVAIITFTGVYNYLRSPVGDDKKVAVSNETAITTKSEDNEDIIPDYIKETNYTGKLSQYPELYQIPFGKSDSYICNKDFSKEHYEVFGECEKDATAFMESLFNVDYRDIASDKNAFIADVMDNADAESVITKGYDTEDEKSLYLHDYIKELSEYFVYNQVEMDAKFYTDDSLVYSDFFTFVRGELVFTIYSSNDEDLEYKEGETYQIPVEVAMHRTPSDPDNRAVCSFGKAEDKTFFMTP